MDFIISKYDQFRLHSGDFETAFQKIFICLFSIIEFTAFFCNSLNLFLQFMTIAVCSDVCISTLVAYIVNIVVGERSGSVVECLTPDREGACSSLTGVTALWSLSKTHLS